jgi:hypothetical protein
MFIPEASWVVATQRRTSLVWSSDQRRKADLARRNRLAEIEMRDDGTGETLLSPVSWFRQWAERLTFASGISPK